jgi:hypothetical protein
MKYPSTYDAYEVEGGKIGPLVYEGRLGRGEATEKMLLKVNDVLAAKLAVDADCVIVDATAAQTWLDQNPDLQALPDEQVTDPDRLLAIVAKNAASVVLSAEDLDALDPDKATKGINRSKKTVATIFTK